MGTRYSYVIVGAMASQITSLTIVYSTVHSGADQRTSKLRVTGLSAGSPCILYGLLYFIYDGQCISTGHELDIDDYFGIAMLVIDFLFTNNSIFSTNLWSCVPVHVYVFRKTCHGSSPKSLNNEKDEQWYLVFVARRCAASIMTIWFASAMLYCKRWLSKWYAFRARPAPSHDFRKINMIMKGMSIPLLCQGVLINEYDFHNSMPTQLTLVISHAATE